MFSRLWFHVSHNQRVDVGPDAPFPLRLRDVAFDGARDAVGESGGLEVALGAHPGYTDKGTGRAIGGNHDQSGARERVTRRAPIHK